MMCVWYDFAQHNVERFLQYECIQLCGQGDALPCVQLKEYNG